VGGLFLDFLNPVPTTHGVIRNADGTIALLDYPGGDNTVLTGINDSGEIIGYTWHEFGTSQITTGFLAIPADASSPEPSTMLLAGSTILLGFGATLLMRRHDPN
jgi:hypothetical protein